MIKKIKNKLIRHLKEVIEIKTSPHSIALGFSLGTFIAIFPTFGLGIFIGLLLIFIFKKISKISMFVSFAVWNPIVLLGLYPISYKIGDFILKNVPVKTYEIEIFNQLFVHSRRFLVGSTILAITTSLLSYLIILLILDKHKRKQAKILAKEYIEKI